MNIPGGALASKILGNSEILEATPKQAKKRGSLPFAWPSGNNPLGGIVAIARIENRGSIGRDMSK